jgi:hypothetical protein
MSMKTEDIILHRLHTQQLAKPDYKEAGDVVSWLIAMQAQEYAHAKWAIHLRSNGLTEKAIEQSFNEGIYLRTHLMRPTWHFVHQQDIRWLLQLTAPRVHAANAYYYKQLELDAKVFSRSNKVLEKALQGGKHLQRTTLAKALKDAKIIASGPRLGYIMMFAELEGLICSGPRDGKQFTYALLEERVPAVKALSREEALAQFVQRYFTTRGPATLQDFVYWSGLTMKDAKEGAEALPADFVKEGELIYLPVATDKKEKIRHTFIMPDYDEYGMSYKDRHDIFNEGARTFYSHMIVVDGKIAGTWKKKDNGGLDMDIFTTLNKTQETALKKAVERYLAFSG